MSLANFKVSSCLAVAWLLVSNPSDHIFAADNGWLVGTDYITFSGGWRLGPHFQIGVGPNYIIDPKELKEVNLFVDEEGFQLSGYGGQTWRCDVVQTQSYETTRPGSIQNLLYVPEELRFAWTRKVSLIVTCSDQSQFGDDRIRSLFISSFNFYYMDGGVAAHTYEPQHGPEFILVRDAHLDH